MRYWREKLDEPEPCDDCGAFTRGWVNHDDGAPADVENGPHADEVPTMHPLCSVCWALWQQVDGPEIAVEVGGEDAHLEAAYEDAQSGGMEWESEIGWS